MRCPVHLIAVVLALSLSALVGCGKKSASPTVAGGDKPNTPSPQAKSTDQLLADLKHTSMDRRSAAMRGFVQLDAAEAIPALLQALSDRGFTEGAVVPGQPNSTREAAVLVLLGMGARAEQELIEAGLPSLQAGLLDANAGVREHAVMAIGLIGKKAKPAAASLIKACADADGNVRRAAYDALRKVEELKPATLVTLINHADAKVAYDAARTLNALRPLPKEIIPNLTFVLKEVPAAPEADERALVKLEAAEALASYGPDAREAVPALVGVLHSTTLEDFDKFFRPRPGADPNSVRNDESPAMMALRKIGKPAVPELAKALESKTALVRWQAALVLAGIGPDAMEAAPALQSALDEEFKRAEISADVIVTAALALVRIGGDAKEPVASVVKLLKEDNAQLRYGVVRMLARFGRKGESAVTALIPLLDDKSEAIRAETVNTLRALGPAAKAAVPALGKKLADEDMDVRRGAAAALKSLGPVAVETTPDLVKLLQDTDDATRREVIEALIAIGPGAKSAAPDLAKLLKARDERERLLAIEALGVIGTEAKAAVPELVELLQEKDVEILVATARALGSIGNAGPSVVGGLSAKLKATQMRVRVAAARALALLGPAANAAEGDLLVFGGSKSKDPDPVAVVWSSVALYRIEINKEANLQNVTSALKNRSAAGKWGRLAAMDAADLLGPAAKSVLPELTDALADNTPVANFDKTPVKQRAALALGKMGPAAKDAVPKLTVLLKETNPDVKRAAIEALAQIGPDADFAAARLREIVRTEPAYAEAAQEALDRIEKK